MSKLTINSGKCLGCGLCTRLQPDVFRMENGVSAVYKQPKITNKIKDAIESCPSEAIEIN